MTALDQLEALMAAINEPAPRSETSRLREVEAWVIRIEMAKSDLAKRLPALLACARALEPFAGQMANIDFEDGDDDMPDWSPFMELRHYRAAAKALKMLEGAGE